MYGIRWYFVDYNISVSYTHLDVYKRQVFNHCGTHVDAPRHFISDAKEISEYDIRELSFDNPLIIDCKKNLGKLITVKDIETINLNGFDCILFRTGLELSLIHI